jgi:ferredoxin--NADP+ reductase
MSSPPRTDHDPVPLNLYRVSSPGTARVVSSVRLTPPMHDDVRHVVLDLDGLDYHFLEGQSLGVLPPGTDSKGHPNKLRLYSIASTRLGDDRRGRSASICVKRVVYPDPATGEEHHGIASNFLCDLAPGDPVAVTGPAGRTFLLPDDPSSNLILLATGTGIAPYRAFLKRIYEELPAWTGQVWLFFGVRTEAECLYREEFDAFQDRPGYHVDYAFSREQQTADGRRMYVQHRLLEHLDEIYPLLVRDNTYLYICGLRGMEGGIFHALESHTTAAVPWLGLKEVMHKSGRLHVEVY